MNASTDWEARIERLCVLSTKMLEMAQFSEWEMVAEHEEQRGILLDELFAGPPPAQWVPLLREAVQATLTSDAQVQELAHVELDKLSDDLRTLKQGRRALQAYHNL